MPPLTPARRSTSSPLSYPGPLKNTPVSPKKPDYQEGIPLLLLIEKLPFLNKDLCRNYTTKKLSFQDCLYFAATLSYIAENLDSFSLEKEYLHLGNESDFPFLIINKKLYIATERTEDSQKRGARKFCLSAKRFDANEKELEKEYVIVIAYSCDPLDLTVTSQESADFHPVPFQSEQSQEFLKVAALNALNLPHMLPSPIDSFNFAHGSIYTQLDCGANLKSLEKGVSHEALSFIIAQFACSLSHLHQEGFCHNDVKPRNGLVKNNLFTLADFDSASKINIILEHLFSTSYLAPEAIRLIRKKRVFFNSKERDTYALGVSILKLIDRKHFFISDLTNNEVNYMKMNTFSKKTFFIYKKIISEAFSDNSSYKPLTKTLVRVALGCLTYSPENRFTCFDVKNILLTALKKTCSCTSQPYLLSSLV